jgi:hypothetical protein
VIEQMPPGPRAPLTGGEVVNTLARLGLLDLAGESPWREAGDDYDVYPIDWDAVEQPIDRQGTLADFDPESQRWDRVLGDLRDRMQRGGGTPPLADPDALAWYQPFHYFGHSCGIYVRESSVISMAEYILQSLPEPRRYDDDAIRGAFRLGLAVLYLHEAFHHRMESFATGLEIVEGRKRYAPYCEQLYRPLLRARSDDLLEEALATAESYRRLGEHVYSRSVPPDVRSTSRAQLKTWFRTLPPGYRQADLCLSNREFEAVLHELCSQIQEAVLSPARDFRDWRLAFSLHRQLFNYKAVTYIVVPVGETPAIPWFDEDRTARLSISSLQLERWLNKRYGYEVKPGAKHQKLVSNGNPTLILPARRKSLSHVVLGNTARSLGFSSERAMVEAALKD